MGRWEGMSSSEPLLPRFHAGAFLALLLKGCFLANLRMSLKFHGLPLSGVPLAMTSSPVCALPRCVSRWRALSWMSWE